MSSLISVSSNLQSSAPAALINAELAVQREAGQNFAAIQAYHQQSLTAMQEMAARIAQLEREVAAERAAKSASEAILNAVIAAKDERIAALERQLAERPQPVNIPLQVIVSPPAETPQDKLARLRRMGAI